MSCRGGENLVERKVSNEKRRMVEVGIDQTLVEVARQYVREHPNEYASIDDFVAVCVREQLNLLKDYVRFEIVT